MRCLMWKITTAYYWNSLMHNIKNPKLTKLWAIWIILLRVLTIMWNFDIVLFVFLWQCDNRTHSSIWIRRFINNMWKNFLIEKIAKYWLFLIMSWIAFGLDLLRQFNHWFLFIICVSESRNKYASSFIIRGAKVFCYYSSIAN